MAVTTTLEDRNNNTANNKFIPLIIFFHLFLIFLWNVEELFILDMHLRL